MRIHTNACRLQFEDQLPEAGLHLSRSARRDLILYCLFLVGGASSLDMGSGETLWPGTMDLADAVVDDVLSVLPHAGLIA